VLKNTKKGMKNESVSRALETGEEVERGGVLAWVGGDQTGALERPELQHHDGYITLMSLRLNRPNVIGK
jgi:hypothetical protein